jgi:ubiquinone/menaquinone biosynthesis C-methylase UbiE
VGFYSQRVFPCLCDFLLGGAFLANYRRQLLAGVNGETLEIGFGSGLNLPCYPPHVRKLTTVDPSVGMHRKAQTRIKASPIAVDQRLLASERLPFEDHTFDCVVSTWTLCSIEHADQALREVYRVLRPGGRFLFLEHGLSSEPAIQKWQRRLNWLEMRLAGGCCLDRNIKDLVAACPFTALEVNEFYLTGIPRTHGYMYRGLAVK